jgi:O-acetyl-ADP-ribose deacetylase (regulator of RNase III)
MVSLQRSVARNEKTAVHLVRGSVLEYSGDALVNAANEGCVAGFGVDQAINDAGGAALKEARRALGGCETGRAKITPSFGLADRVKWIIHAVGPVYRATSPKQARLTVEAKDALLANAYREALDRAREVGARTVGFALLSAGVFRGDRSLVDVLAIGVETVAEYADPSFQEITVVAHTDEEQEALLQVASCVLVP